MSTKEKILAALDKADRALAYDGRDREEAEFICGNPEAEDDLVLSFPSGDNAVASEDLENAEILADGSGFNVAGTTFRLFTSQPVVIQT